MRYIRYFFLLAVGLVLFIVALANRGAVTLRIVPEDAARLLPFPNAWEVPLFVVLFGGIVAGLLIGFVWEYIREHRIRAEAAARRREAAELKREVEKLKQDKPGAKDDVLALLE